MAVYTIQIPEGSPDKTKSVLEGVIVKFISEYCSKTDNGYVIRTGCSFTYEIHNDRVDIYTTFEKEDVPEKFRYYLLGGLDTALKDIEKEYSKQQRSGGLAFLYLLIPAIIGLGALILGIILHVGLSWDGYQLSRQMTSGTFLSVYIGVAAALLAVEISFMITGSLQREGKKASTAGLLIRIVVLGLLVAVSVFLFLTGKNIFLLACIALLVGTACGLAGGIASLVRVKQGHFQPFPSSSGYAGASAIAITVFLLLILTSSSICGMHEEAFINERFHREFELENMTMTEYARDHFDPADYSHYSGNASELADAMELMLENHGVDAHNHSAFTLAAHTKAYFALREDNDRDMIIDTAWKAWLANTLVAGFPDEVHAYDIQQKTDITYEEKKTEYIDAVNKAYAALLEDPRLQERVDIFNFILDKARHSYSLISPKEYDENDCCIMPITVEEMQTDWWDDPDSSIKFALNYGGALLPIVEWYFGTRYINTLIDARIMGGGLYDYGYYNWEKYDLAETPWDYENIASLIVYDGEGSAYVGINTIRWWDMSEYHLVMNRSISRYYYDIELPDDARTEIISFMKDNDLHSMPSDYDFRAAADPDSIRYLEDYLIAVPAEGEKAIVLVNPDWTVEVHRIADMADENDRDKWSGFIDDVMQTVQRLVDEAQR